MIDCPVDGRKNITSSICPQCKTDLSPLIYISELPDTLFLKGIQFLTDNQVDEAIKEFITALAIEPENVKYLLALGEAYLLKGMIEDALKCSSLVLTLEPGNEESNLLEKECNIIKDRQLQLKQKELVKNRIFWLLFCFVPFFTLLIGFFISFAIDVFNNESPNQIAQNVMEVLLKNNEFKELQVEVAYHDKTYVLSGIVPSGLHRTFVEETLLNNISKNQTRKNEKIKNTIIVQPKQLFISYLIQHNDNLTKISKLFLGSPNKWPILMQYNKDIISKPNKLKVGESIRIPINEYN